MTIPQIKGFMDAILKRQASQSAVFISNVAVGAQADQKGIKKALESYSQQRKQISDRKPRSKNRAAEEEEFLRT